MKGRRNGRDIICLSEKFYKYSKLVKKINMLELIRVVSMPIENRALKREHGQVLSRK